MFKEKLLKKALRMYAGEHVANNVLTYGRKALSTDFMKYIPLTTYVQDVKGFSYISEDLNPHDLLTMLNEYLKITCQTIHQFGGIIDQFDGNIIIGAFGYENKNNHAEQACLAALSNIEKIESANEKWGIPHIVKLSIGINSGPTFIGNIGSKERLSFTAAGDSANLAFTMESSNKFYDTDVLISEYSKELLGKSFVLREMDLLPVVGKKDPISVYELLDGGEC